MRKVINNASLVRKLLKRKTATSKSSKKKTQKNNSFLLYLKINKILMYRKTLVLEMHYYKIVSFLCYCNIITRKKIASYTYTIYTVLKIIILFVIVRFNYCCIQTYIYPFHFIPHNINLKLLFMTVWSYLGLILIGIAPVAFKIVHYYAEPGFPWHTYITTFIG